jgi:multicomponent K+:H+ antiporter subunit G
MGIADLPLWADALVASLLVAAAGFAFVGSLGLAKLSDFFSRLHGPTKAATLGVGGALLASMIHFGVRDGAVSLHEVLIAVFVFVTAPVSGHLLAKAALHLAGQSLPGDAAASQGEDEVSETRPPEGFE